MKKLIMFFLIAIPLNVLSIDPPWIPNSMWVDFSGAVALSRPSSTTTASSFYNNGIGLMGFFLFYPTSGQEKRIFAVKGNEEELKNSKLDETIVPGAENFIDLERINTSTGFKVIERNDKAKYLDVYISGGFDAFTAVGLSIEFLYRYSSSVTAIRFAQTIQEANLLPWANIPKDVDDVLASLRYPGDIIEAKRKEPIFINTRASVGPIVASVSLATKLDSTWHLILKKPLDSSKGDPTVELTFLPGKDKGIKAGLALTLFIVSGGKTIKKTVSEIAGFSYIFDLDNKFVTKEPVEVTINDKLVKFEKLTPQIAYQYAIGGIMMPAQILSGIKGSGVIDKGISEIKSKKKVKVNSFSIPAIISKTGTKEKEYYYDQVINAEENQMIFDVSGVYTKNYKTTGPKALGIKNYQKTAVFKVTYQSLVDLDDPDVIPGHRLFGNINYRYEGNEASINDIDLALKKIGAYFGYTKHLKPISLDPEAVNRAYPLKTPPEKPLPEIINPVFLKLKKTLGIPKDVDKVENFLVDFNVNLSHEAILEWMNIPQEFTQEEFVQQGPDYIEAFFADFGKDYDLVCKKFHALLVDQGAVRLCKKHLVDETKSGLLKIYKNLLAIKNYTSPSHPKINPEEAKISNKLFMQKWASIGKQMLTNRFIFKTMIRVLRFEKNSTVKDREFTLPGPIGGSPIEQITTIPMEVTLSIQGNRFNPYNAVLYKGGDKKY